MKDSHGTPAPGLVATVLYLRPAPRAEIVSMMIELGMFVREFELNEWVESPPTPPASEVTVVFAEESLSHLQLAERTSSDSESVIVVLPAGPIAEPFQKCGAFALLSESDSPKAFRDALAAAGQLARRTREVSPVSRRTTTVFGGLQFCHGEPWLASGVKLAGLSPTEHSILRVLVTARGTVVAKDILQRQLSGSDEPATDGYLKTVVLRIRRKVELLGGDSARLAAVRGTGYMLRA